MELKVLPRGSVMPWLRRHKDRAYWLDRLALIGFATSINLFALENGWWPRILNLIFEDILSKEQGYLYAFQTIISAIVAFIAATIAYLSAHYADKKKSYTAVSNIMALTSGLRGKIWYISDRVKEIHMNEDCTPLLKQMRGCAEEIKSCTDFYFSSDISYNLRLEIEPVVSTLITILRTLESRFLAADLYIENNDCVFENEFIKSIVDLRKDMDGTYNLLDKYKDKEFCEN